MSMKVSNTWRASTRRSSVFESACTAGVENESSRAAPRRASVFRMSSEPCKPEAQTVTECVRPGLPPGAMLVNPDRGRQMHEIQADEVLEIARKRGLSWIDREIATRIAAGAQAA